MNSSFSVHLWENGMEHFIIIMKTVLTLWISWKVVETPSPDPDIMVWELLFQSNVTDSYDDQQGAVSWL